MPKQVDAERQRREIRRVARQVFSRRGVGGTGLVHVAKAAGMGRSSLYHYYRDKKTLLRDLLAEALASEEALFAEMLGGSGSALERIERLHDALLATFEEWSRVGRTLVDLRLRDAPGFRSFLRRIRKRLRDAIAEGQHTGEIDASLDADLCAALLIGAVDGLLFQRLVDERAFPEPAALRRCFRTTLRRVLAP
jgi:AcrR family transcriptional regulator